MADALLLIAAGLLGLGYFGWMRHSAAQRRVTAERFMALMERMPRVIKWGWSRNDTVDSITHQSGRIAIAGVAMAVFFIAAGLYELVVAVGNGR